MAAGAEDRRALPTFVALAAAARYKVAPSGRLLREAADRSSWGVAKR